MIMQGRLSLDGEDSQLRRLRTEDPTEPEMARRIRDGQAKIWAKWQEVRRLEGSRQDAVLEVWDRAVDKLKGLAAELAREGYRGCLYHREKPIYPCLVCLVPDFRKEGCPAWSLEFC